MFDIWIRRCIVTEIWRYEYRYSWPSIDIVARVQQWTALNLNTRTQFKMFNTNQCLIWSQRNTTGLIRASHLRNTEISAKCDNVTYLCQPGNHMYALSLSTRINALTFWKHRLACSLAISTSIFSDNCNSSTYERARERERERCCVCMNYHRNNEAVALIPLDTMMLPSPCWER